MLFGIQTELFEDSKSRKVLHIKNSDVYYQVNKEEDLRVFIFKKGFINSLSLSLIFGLVLQWPIWAYVVSTVCIYLLILWIFNVKTLPFMSIISPKSVVRKEVEKKDRQFSLIGIAYLVIGFGLLYCFLTNQVESGMMTYIVIGAIAISLVMGVTNLFTYTHRS